MSEVFYTTSSGEKKKDTIRFAHPLEAKIYISDLFLAECKDIFVKTDCVVYNSDGEPIDYIFDDSDYV